MLKNKYIFIFICAFQILTSISAESRPLPFYGFEKGQRSMSFLAGQPTIFRYDYFLSWKRSWGVDAGYHFDGYPYFATDYTVYFYDIKDRYRYKDFFNSLMFYAGPGFFIGPDFKQTDNSKKIKVGLRAYVGSEYLFLKSNHYSVKAEVGPAFFLEGDHSIGLQAMVGMTYYFGGFSRNQAKTVSTSIIDDAPTKNPAPPSSTEDDKAFKDFD